MLIKCTGCGLLANTAFRRVALLKTVQCSKCKAPVKLVQWRSVQTALPLCDPLKAGAGR